MLLRVQIGQADAAEDVGKSNNFFSAGSLCTLPSS